MINEHNAMFVMYDKYGNGIIFISVAQLLGKGFTFVVPLDNVSRMQIVTEEEDALKKRH